MKPDDPISPMAAAMQWVSRVFAMVGAMIVPSVAGGWLDQRVGTTIFAPLGLVAGLILGMAYLLAMTRRGKS